MVPPLMLVAAVSAMQAATPAPPSQTATPSVGQPFSRQRVGRGFMSPMGEPFFGRRPGEDGLSVWFEQADGNHDGMLTIDELEQDAKRFFLTLDTDHDGEIDPDEITHYEDVIAPQVRTGPIATDASIGDSRPQERGRGGRPPRGGRHGGHGGAFDFGGFDDEAGAGRFGLLQIPEPVASADSNFNRGVSSDEFQHAAVSRFELLDINHTGRLTLAQLQAFRQAASAAARGGRRPASGDQAGPDESVSPSSIPIAGN